MTLIVAILDESFPFSETNKIFLQKWEINGMYIVSK